MVDNPQRIPGNIMSPAEERRIQKVKMIEERQQYEAEFREAARIEYEKEMKRKQDEFEAAVRREEERLMFHTLRRKHEEDLKNSLPVYSESDACAQEQRQSRMTERVFDLSVNVAREDFPSLSAKIPVSYRISSAPGDWRVFLETVRKTLNLEYIDSIIDRRDGSVVHRVHRLINNGEYFVRITETSAVVEALITHEVPVGDSWKITKFISSASNEVRWHEGKIVIVDKRVDELISRPKIRVSEREAVDALLKATTPEEILKVVEIVMTEIEIPVPFLPSTFKPDPEVDTVNVHRMAFESLNRLAARGMGKEVAKVAINFIDSTIVAYKMETDVVVMGLRLITDIIPFLIPFKLQIIHLLLNCVQLYAPPEHMCRPRNPQRLQGEGKAMLEKELAIKREEDRRLAEIAAKKAEEERLRLEEEARKKKEIEDELERLRLEEEAKQEKYRRKIEKQKAKQRAALAHMLAQGIQPEVPKRSLEEVRSVRKWSGTVGVTQSTAQDTSSSVVQRPNSAVALPPLPLGTATATITKSEVNADGSNANDTEPEPSPRNKIQLKPLPVVPGVKFRGLAKDLQKDMCLVQTLITIYKFVSNSFGYREAAYTVYLHEEIAEVGLVCQGLPRAMQYILYIVDKMFSDGLLDIDDDANSLNSNFPSMVVSLSPRDDRTIPSTTSTVDSVLNVEIDAVSEASIQTVDLDFVNDELTPRVNMGDFSIVYPEEEPPVKDEDEPEEEEMNITNIAVDLDPAKAAAASPKPKAVQKGRKGKAKKKVEEDEDDFAPVAVTKELIPYVSVIKSDTVLNYRKRYLTRPFDPLVLFMAMTSKHRDLDPADREMASMWIRLWDDASLNFKSLLKRGANYCEL